MRRAGALPTAPPHAEAGARMVSVAAMRRCPLVAQIGHWHVYSITFIDD